MQPLLKIGYSLALNALLLPTLLGQMQLPSKDTPDIEVQNSKQFYQYSQPTTIDQIIDMPGNKHIEHFAMIRSSPSEGGEMNPFGKTRESYLLRQAANSTLIVTAEPLSLNSQLTEGHHFIFTDYVFTVDRILRTKGITVLPGQQIVVTRAGGIVTYRGVEIVGEVPGFELFHLNEPYVLFLHLLPNGTFITYENGAYNIAKENVVTRPFTAHDNLHDSLISRDTFLADVNSAIAKISGGIR